MKRKACESKKFVEPIVVAPLQPCTTDPSPAFALARAREVTHLPSALAFGEMQTTFNEAYLHTCIELCARVCVQLRISTTTLGMAIGYVHRFFAVVPTKKKDVTVVVMTCLAIAVKLEEVTQHCFEDICDAVSRASTCRPGQMKDMERVILSTINYNLLAPGVVFFSSFYEAGLPTHLAAVTRFFALVANAHVSVLGIAPSLVAAACCLEALERAGVAWCPGVQGAWGIDEMETRATAPLLFLPGDDESWPALAQLCSM